MLLPTGSNPAIYWNASTISFDALHQAIDGCAVILDVAPGDRVALFAENRPEWVTAFYAAWRRDAIVVPIDYLSTADDVAFILGDCRPRVLVCSRTSEPVLRDAVALATAAHADYAPTLLLLDELPEPVTTPSEPMPMPDDEERTALIIYTSGTTGVPKGVMLSFRNLMANALAVTRDVPIFRGDRPVLVLLPLHHTFPLMGSMVAPLMVGSMIAFTPSLAADDIMATLQGARVAIIIGVPRFYSMLRKGIRDKINAKAVARLLFRIAERKQSRAFSQKVFGSVHRKFGGNVQYMVCGGAALDPEVERDYATLGFEVLVGYGMTECAPMITFPRPGNTRPLSSGQLLPGCEVKIENGEILVRGANVMQGYWGQPDETAAALRDGWLCTGDLGHFDAEGHIFITGRAKEIIVLSNGKNISPVEVEQKLEAQSPLVSEVAVFLDGDVLHALLVPDMARVGETADVADLLRREVVDAYNADAVPAKKVLRMTVSMTELPKTRLGKIRRFALPELAAGTTVDASATPEPEFEELALLRTYLAREKGVEVRASTHLAYELSLDSLDLVSLQVFLERTFGVVVPAEQIAGFGTVGALAAHLRGADINLDVEEIDWGSILAEPATVQFRRSWFTYTFIKNMSRVLFSVYFRVRGRGVENIPDGPAIFAPNHQSFIDGLFVTMFLRNLQLRRTYFYAKEKHLRQRWLKFMADRHNVIIMDMNKDLKLSLQKLAAVLRTGRSVIIFPEGTRTRDGRLGEYKKTFAILSSELGVPVVPVAIQGAYRALPHGAVMPRPFTRVSVDFLPPVHPAGHSYDSLTQTVVEAVRRHLG
jgi:long-chain acyl-CoA synthetase